MAETKTPDSFGGEFARRGMDEEEDSESGSVGMPEFVGGGDPRSQDRGAAYRRYAGAATAMPPTPTSDPVAQFDDQAAAAAAMASTPTSDPAAQFDDQAAAAAATPSTPQRHTGNATLAPSAPAKQPRMAGGARAAADPAVHGYARMRPRVFRATMLDGVQAGLAGQGLGDRAGGNAPAAADADPHIAQALRNCLKRRRAFGTALREPKQPRTHGRTDDFDPTADQSSSGSDSD